MPAEACIRGDLDVLVGVTEVLVFGASGSQEDACTSSSLPDDAGLAPSD